MPVKIIAAGGLVINEKKELLMIFRRGKWDLPKGKLDKGERPEECALREVKEETGIMNLELGNSAGLTYHKYFDTHLHKDVLKETHWFAMKANSSAKLIPQAEEDIEQIVWADENKLKECLKNTYPNIIEIIGKFKEDN